MAMAYTRPTNASFSFNFRENNMRPSTASHRASQAANSQANLAAAAAKLVEKKKEYDAVAALDRASQLYLERIEGLTEDCFTMAQAGEGLFNFALSRR
jgi:DASH complex subunit DAD2